MWDEDPDIYEEMDEHDLEHESGDDFADFGADSEIGVLGEGEAFDEYSSYLDDER